MPKFLNGWVGDNPHGYATDNRFHYRFESEFVEARVKPADVRAVAGAAPRLLPDVRLAVVAYLGRSHAEVDRLYALDRAAPFDAQNDRPEHRCFAAERLAAAVTMLRDLWWTAWVTSADSSTTADGRGSD